MNSLLSGVMVLMTRGPESGFARVELFDTVAPRLVGFGEPSRFTF